MLQLIQFVDDIYIHINQNRVEEKLKCRAKLILSVTCTNTMI
jgi:hypothetical protein